MKYFRRVSTPSEGQPSTSAQPSIPNYAIPEELLSSVLGSWNRWRILVIAAFCVIMTFDGLNLFASQLYIPQDLEFNCTQISMPNNPCFLANGSRCRTFTFSKRYGYTLTEKWHLVCDRAVKVDMSHIAFRCGLAFGYIVMGNLSDRWGRKRILFTCLILQPCSAILVTASKTYTAFIISRSLNGLVLSGTALIAIVLTSEISNNKWRTFDIGLLCLSFAIGHTLLPSVWMIFADSMKNILVMSVPQILLIVSIAIVRESPNWLLCKNKTFTAESVLISVARFNGQRMPSTFRLRPVQIINISSTRSMGVVNLLKSSTVRWVMGGLYLIWLLTTLLNGLLMDLLITETKNRLKIVFLSGISSIIGASMSLILCHLIKHRVVIAVSSILGGITLSISYMRLIQNTEEIFMLFHLSAYGFFSLGLFTIWNLTPRVFPTETRAEGTGVAIAIGELSFTFANLLLPFVFNTVKSSLITLWLCIFVIVLSCTVLVSVHKRELPDIMEDAINFRRTCKPTRWSTLREASPTIDETEVKMIDFERAASINSADPIMPRIFQKSKPRDRQ